jgi:hypothetical protein
MSKIVKMRKVSRDWKSWDQSTRPQIGDFEITKSPRGGYSIVMVLPRTDVSGDYSICRIPIDRVKAEDNWEWDGNENAPTLHPSVHQHYIRDGQQHTIWHGWIRNGEMVSE